MDIKLDTMKENTHTKDKRGISRTISLRNWTGAIHQCTYYISKWNTRRYNGRARSSPSINAEKTGTIIPTEKLDKSSKIIKFVWKLAYFLFLFSLSLYFCAYLFQFSLMQKKKNLNYIFWCLIWCLFMQTISLKFFNTERASFLLR